MDTRFGLAKALAAWCAWNAVNQEWIAWGGPECIEAIAFGRSALADSPDNPSVLRLAGSAVGFLAHDLDIGRAALDRAVTLNANSAQILGSSGWFRVGQGEFEVARNHFTLAMRLSPLDSETHFFQTGLAVALVLGEPAEPERGLDVVRKALIGRPNLRTALHAQACCLVKLGRLEEAKGTARQFLAIWPHFTLSEFRRRTPFCAQVADTIIGLLRRAGFPE